MNTEILGFLAGIMVSVSLIPQIVRSFKTKSTNDISLPWNIINIVGQILWLVYGFAINSVSLYVMSGISLILVGIMLVLKLRYGMPKQ